MICGDEMKAVCGMTETDIGETQMADRLETYQDLSGKWAERGESVRIWTVPFRYYVV